MSGLQVPARRQGWPVASATDKKRLKNLQTAARRRDLALVKFVNDDETIGYGMLFLRNPSWEPMHFEDLAEVTDELRSRPIEA